MTESPRVAGAPRRGVSWSAAARPVVWPLTQGDLPRGRDVACAAVLVAAEALAGQQQPAWVTGVGWATERYDLAERDLTRSEQLRPRPRRTVGAALHGFAGQVVSTSWWERR